MTIICCQIQIGRLTVLVENDITDICAKMQEGWSESISYESGNDNGRYVNLFVRTRDRSKTWDRIRTQLIDSEVPNGELRDAMIITMTGAEGWDDYLLLHHFDCTEILDTIK